MYNILYILYIILFILGGKIMKYNLSRIFSRAWKLARKIANKFNKKYSPADFFSYALKRSWAIEKGGLFGRFFAFFGS